MWTTPPVCWCMCILVCVCTKQTKQIKTLVLLVPNNSTGYQHVKDKDFQVICQTCWHLFDLSDCLQNCKKMPSVSPTWLLWLTKSPNPKSFNWHKRLRKAGDIHFWEGGTRDFFYFLLEKMYINHQNSFRLMFCGSVVDQSAAQVSN